MRKHLAFWLIVVASQVAAPAMAGEILKSISFSEKDKRIELKANFGANVDYVKHFPMTRGKIIQIQIQVDNKTFSEDDQKRRETLEPPANAPIALRDAIYEGNVRGGPYLVFRFDQVVTFELGKEKNSRSLSVFIEKDNQVAQTVTAPPVESSSQPSAVVDAKGATEAESKLIAGRQALTRGDNNDAIIKFTEVINMPPNDYAQDAKEYLGLARERNGQLEMARKEYEEYLKTYEKTPKAGTVRQRLMTLVARIEDTERRLKEAKRAQAQANMQVNDTNPNTFGRASMLYYGAVNNTSDGTKRIANRVLSFLDVTSRKRSDIQEMRIVFSGSNDTDFDAPSSSSSSASTKEKQDTRIRSLFIDYKNKQRGTYFIGGRQSVNSGGVLGRIDGVLGGYELRPNLRLFGVAGVPVDYQEFDKIQSNRPVYGARLDVDDIVKDLKGTIYGIEQKIGGVNGYLDRRAVGGDLRFFRQQTMLFGLIDYDISYKVINFMTGHVGWSLNEATKFDLHLDDRKSPVLLTSNALTGIANYSAAELGIGADEYQAIKDNPTVENAMKYLPEEQLRKLAIDNTGRSRMATLGITRSIAKDMDFNGTVTYSSYEASPAAIAQEEENLAQNPNTQSTVSTSITDSYSVAGQLMRRNWYIERDIFILGLRLSTDQRQKQASANFTARWPYTDRWWLDVRGRLMYITSANGPEYRITPTFRLEYRYNRSVTLESELSSDVIRSQNADSIYTYGNGGFRYVF